MRAGFIKEQDQVGAKGTVLHQKPPAGEKAVAGAAVDLIMAVPPKVPAPRLVGLTVTDATALATAAGMTVGPDMPRLESPEPAGVVLIQDPPAGELVRPGIAISIVVATPETTLVPDLTGKRPGEAAVLVRNNRLVLADPPYPTQEASGAWGNIILQDLAAGSRQVVNSKVTPTLAAPPLVAIPDLTGKTVDQAPKLLSDGAAGALNRVGLPQQPPGLVIGRVTLAENAASPGTILSQSPVAGPNQNLSIYSTVDISVATPVTVAVPSVVGSTEAAAITAIQNAGLLAISQRRQDPVAAGTVLSQDPPANSRKALGTGVSLVVSTTVQVRVPSLAKHSLEFATETLVSASMRVGTVTRKPTLGVPPGSILDQSVAAGAMVDIGTAINLTIAGDTAQVPQLQGQSQAAAQKLISDAGLVLVMGSPVESATVIPGLIAGQSPAAGTTVPVGSTVTANPAIPPKIAVPNLIGKTIQQAQQLATNFVISVTGQAESDQPPGTIAVQNPAPPATASPQSVITVQTAVPRGVAVPNFVGQTLTAAQAQAAAVKLALSVSSRTLSDKPGDIVLTQNPAAGVRIAPNSAVVITVSSGIAVRVPSVTKLQLAAAIKKLQAAGLVGEVTDTVPSIAPIGFVVSQSPAAGALVASGTVVSLTTSEGKEPNKFVVGKVNPALTTSFTP